MVCGAGPRRGRLDRRCVTVCDGVWRFVTLCGQDPVAAVSTVASAYAGSARASATAAYDYVTSFFDYGYGDDEYGAAADNANDGTAEAVEAAAPLPREEVKAPPIAPQRTKTPLERAVAANRGGAVAAVVVDCCPADTARAAGALLKVTSK